MTNLTLPESGGQMRVSVILDSISAGTRLRLTTIHVRVPRIIWPEIMTHRTFGRNARSSRAVPISRMIAEVRSAPFVPWHWTGAQKGMQGTPDHDAPVRALGTFGDDEISAREAWIRACGFACDAAQSFAEAQYHKQVANRLLEPFMYIDGLITSCQWANFIWLRDHGAAEPHFQDLARMVTEAFSLSNPQEILPGEWHLPYVTEADREEAARRFGAATEQAGAFLRKVSAARCARISYAPFDGDASYEAELARYDLLVSSDRVHASPLEHQATPDRRVLNGQWASPHLHGNLPGFIQARKLVPGDFVPG